MKPMSDDELKREIEKALSVDPSPRFAAGVRARTARNPRPSFSWSRWGIPAAGLALAAIVVAAVLQPREETTLVPQATIKRIETLPAPEPKQPPVEARRVAPSLPRRAPEPEVLVDPRVAAGLEKFIEGVQEHRIDVSKLMELQQASLKPATIDEIALMPIAPDPIIIEPLNIGARRSEGGNL